MTVSQKIAVALFAPLLALASLLMLASPAHSTDPAHAFKLGVSTASLTDLNSFDAAINRQADIFLWYQHINQSLDTDIAYGIAAQGRTLQLSWEPIPNPKPAPFDPTVYQLKKFTRGDFDTDLRRWADELRDFGYPVLFRPFCEMNGDWTYWGGNTNGNVPADFVPAWRHVHDIFVQEGATNVQFVWSPNRDGSVGDAIYTFDNYYPGDAYLDYIGFSGYNWGNLYTVPPCTWDSNWQNPVQVFGDSYDVMTARSNKPIIISEMASPEQGGDKAAWITEFFNQLPARFPRIVAVTWFNLLNREECLVADTDWRVQSSPTAQAAFAAGIQHLDETDGYRCGAPGFVLSATIRWASYSDYEEGALTTDFNIANAGLVDAYRFKIDSVSSTNGVELLTAMPVKAGNFSAGTSAHVRLTYRIPPGVYQYVTWLHPSVEDSCGASYIFPVTISRTG